MRRGCDGVEGNIGRSFDEIEGVTMTVNENCSMLSEITVCVCMRRVVDSARVRSI